MDERAFTFWLVVFAKLSALAYIVLPGVLIVSSFMFTLFSGQEPTEHTLKWSTALLALFIGFTSHKWFYGHRAAVDEFYDNKEE